MYKKYACYTTRIQLTGKVMTSEQMILAVGNTSPMELIRGIRMFDKYVDLQRGGAE
ncbi:hypothetical protein [Bacillus sp. 37MA]|uniref:hypothetical protein n=1 Tax=Bacillus sp. 37MA TaxID=1132442 RepID=UPI0003793804|nr:hypothetical protein [Bacillus sp. 37MA]